MMKKSNNNYKKRYYKKKNIEQTIEKRYVVISILIIILLLFLMGYLFFIQVVQHDIYKEKVDRLNLTYVYGESAPRGRIYDRNGKIIVDNTPIKVIYYKKPVGVTTKDEIDLAYKVAELISVDYEKLYITNLKEFWIVNHKEEANLKITHQEWKEYEERKLTAGDIQRLKLERITEEELSEYDILDKKAAYIYYLMNTGYSYSEKIIKDVDVTDAEYAIIAESISELKGFNTRLDWERSYPYKDTFRTLLGGVSTSKSGIPYELKDYYLNLGYSLNDRVGTSYLEYQYESILKGEKNKYQVLEDGSYKLVSEGKRGNDITLTIDIELQREVEEIIMEHLISAQKEMANRYYNHSFVIITDPKTGEILAMAGKQIVKTDDGYEFYDYSPGIITSPVTVGSSIKGASHIVGYNTGALKIGEVRKDFCIKIAATPEKCSLAKLGSINDLGALRSSSNSYQYQTAIKVGKGIYRYNQPLYLDPEAFTIYRSTFAEFGLGVKTEIDLPVESLGYKGDSTLPGYLLDFSIGQYDTYTPIQLSQYINTIANDGTRIAPHLLKEVYAPTKDGLSDLLWSVETRVLNNVQTEEKYMKRVQEGFYQVMHGGTGSSYIPWNYKAAGKTGTSQSFLDTDLDGNIDTETLSSTFVGYYPYDDPKVTFTVISPNIGYSKNGVNYKSYVNQRITYDVSRKYAEMYP